MEFQFELPLYTLYMHLVLPHAARPLSLVITLLYLVLGPLPSFLRKTGSAPSLQLGGRDDVHVPGGRNGLRGTAWIQSSIPEELRVSVYIVKEIQVGERLDQ